MKKYIDFDGVILDTSPLLFKEWYEQEHQELTENDKILYVQRQDWNYILHNSPIINDSLYYLRYLNKEEYAILTTIHSLENEGVNKVKFLRENHIEIPIILVPYLVDKTQVVNPQNNILIDDRVYNLEVWEKSCGHSIFFNKNNLDVDEWHQENIKYQKINTLNNLGKIKVRNRK